MGAVRYYKWGRRAKYWSERIWWEKLLFWVEFEKLVCIECCEDEATHEEVLVQGKNPFYLLHAKTSSS